MWKKKDIHCPECKMKVMTYDGRGQLPISVMCRSCQKLVSYIPATKEIKISNVPERTCPSGTRIW